MADMTNPSKKPTRRNIWSVFSDSSITGPLLTFIIVFILCSLFVPRFFTLRTVTGIISAATLTGVVAIGISLLMISGEFDLSAGANLAMGAYVFGLLAQVGQPVPGIILALVVTALLGWVNGMILVKTKIPSFIVTLGTRSIIRGAVWILSGGALLQTIEELPIYNIFNGRMDIVNDLFPGSNFRTSALWLIGLVILFQYILVRTRFGNHLFAVGGNPFAARGQGVNVNRVKVIGFMISGVLAGFTGILLYSQYMTVKVMSGDGTELSAIAAAVVGGTLIDGGAGSVWGALIGVLIISTLRSAVVLLDIPFIPADNFEAIVGVTIILAAILNSWLRRRSIK